MTQVPLTRFIGRRRDVTEIRRLLGETRLLSLVGPGGSGKTRLARELCSGPDAVWVELAELDRPRSVAPAVADALGLPEDSLADRLAHRSVLLVLDNCEHLVEACAALAGELLRACPGLRVLTTSREPLAVAGEHVWWVDGLPGDESAQLFADRARRVAPGFRLDDDNADAVARLCRRLDGMPLALELAAARVRMLPPRRILARLDDAFGLLVTADRDVPARHATLRAALDWSYRLLPEPERDLFARLAVFRGGFTLDAAEAVAGPDALSLLARLADKSLVQAYTEADGERYRLLEVVRQYAESLGTPAEAADRHAAYHLAYAETADARLAGPDQERWLDRLHRERDNLRAAFTHAIAHDPAAALRLAAALGRYHRLRGGYAEGGERLRAALAQAPPGTPPAVLAKALAGLGVLEFLQCAYEPAATRLGRAVELFDRLGDPRGAATALQNLGGIAREQGRYADARAHHRRALDAWRRLGDPAGTARAVKALAFTAWLEGDYAHAATLAGDALHRFRELGDPEGMIGALVDLGAALLRAGEPERARPMLREALDLSRRLSSEEGIAWATEQLGLAALALGAREEAEPLLRAALVGHHEAGDRWRTAGVLDTLAGLLADARTAAVLLAAAATTRAAIGTPLPPCDRLDHERCVRAVTERLGPGEAELAAAEGRSLPLGRAVELALAAPAPSPATPGTPDAAPPRPVPADPETASETAQETPPARVVPAVPAAAPPTLAVYALGRPRVLVGDRALTAEDWTYAKPRELLYHLLTHPGAGKAEIGAALWPEAGPAALRNSFHTCVKHLRRALAGAATVSFAAGGYRVEGRYTYDVDLFRDAAESADAGDLAALTEAAARYPGDFLPGDAAGDWAAVPRDRLRRGYERVMLARGLILGRERRFAEAAEIFSRLIEHDPLLEAAHRGLMRCHAALGNPARALRQYDDLVDLLHTEIGAPASPETRALRDRLRHAMAA